jgi:3-oxoacyl-[acyl-carrier-protein] synthase I
MTPVTILKSGMVTGVGFSAAASCAAIRVGITGFVETKFMFGGEWIYGCPVPFEVPWRGREKLLQMVTLAIKECCDGVDNYQSREVPLILCVAETGRPGRFADLDQSFLDEVQKRLDLCFHDLSALIAEGRIGGAKAVAMASKLIADGRPYCIVAGVDALLITETLAHLNEKRRLLTADNSDGFIPGEAAAAVLLGPKEKGFEPQLVCLGFGDGFEKVNVYSEEPLHADGLSDAIKAALADAGKTFKDLDYRITDVSGEEYAFREASLALSRSMRILKPEFDIWHPADCIGEVGAAIVPCILGVALTAARKEYAPGKGVLCHFSGDFGDRAALVAQYQGELANEQ